jgi:acetoin utilization deacetylase AcuC-like enzyme
VQEGANDKTFLDAYKPVIDKIMEVFNPGAIVLQCGADSLMYDRLGYFNLSIDGACLSWRAPGHSLPCHV